MIDALSPLLGCPPGVPDSITGWHNSWGTHPWWAAKPPAEGWKHHWLCKKGEKIELIRKERTLYSRWCLWFQVAQAISKMIKQKRNLLKRYWADHRIIESKLETSVQGDAPNQSSEKTAAEPLHSRLSELDHHHLCIRTSLLLQPLLLPAAMPLLPQKSNFASFTPNTNPKCCAFLL